MNFEIVIIDDNMKSSDPFVRRLEKVFQDARVILFPDVQKSLDYIFDNLSKKLIVFLDCKFDTGLQGIDGLKRIREKTSLLYIVMMSANSPLQQPVDDIIEMINNKGIYFINNADMRKAEEIVERIKYNWNTDFDCVLEQWILQHEEEADNPFVYRGKESYTLRKILDEVRRQTGFGKDIERIMYKSTIQSLLDSKLDD
ncbi:hypothetical protein [Alistipes finegoldii]|uniref:hypothetical protein n=1 Tax=Alistipes finegoldii TaxID=214856 RepID=UPI003AF0043E